MRQDRMGGYDLPVREEWSTGGMSLHGRVGGALVLVMGFVGAGQGVLAGFTSSVAPLASAFAGMTLRGSVR